MDKSTQLLLSEWDKICDPFRGKEWTADKKEKHIQLEIIKNKKRGKGNDRKK